MISSLNERYLIFILTALSVPVVAVNSLKIQLKSFNRAFYFFSFISQQNIRT